MYALHEKILISIATKGLHKGICLKSKHHLAPTCPTYSTGRYKTPMNRYNCASNYAISTIADNTYCTVETTLRV